MYINEIFELTRAVNGDEFDRLFARVKDNLEEEEGEEYADRSLSHKGVTVIYRKSRYKKKVRLVVNTAFLFKEKEYDSGKIVPQLEKRVAKYFGDRHCLEEFVLTEAALMTDLRMEYPEDVLTYLRLLRRIGKVAQYNEVKAVDIVPEKVEKINRRVSPIRDDYIEKYLAEKELDLEATLDGKTAYTNADLVIIAAPTNYDSKKNFFDTSAVEGIIRLVIQCNPDAIMVIKSTVPVGFTAHVREKFHCDNILFSPEFLRESKALYDNLYPSRIIVGTDTHNARLVKAAKTFAGLLKEGAIKENVNTLIMGFTEAEAVKLFANTYLALRVSYFNELDTYAEMKGLKG